MFEPQGLTRGVSSLGFPLASKIAGAPLGGFMLKDPSWGSQFYPLLTIQ